MMPTYRLQDRHGNERTLQAARVVSDGTRVRFENQNAGLWQPVFSLPADELQSLMRRVNEASGWRWIRARVTPVTHRHAPH